MTEAEIKEYTEKLEKLLIRFEATLTFEERQIWNGIEKLLEHYEQVQKENETLKGRNKFLEHKIAANFDRHSMHS